MADNGRIKIPTGAIVTVAVVILIAVLGFLGVMVRSNADEISGVKAETKGNTTAIGFQGQSLIRIEASLDRLEERFNTRPAKR